MNCRYCGSVYTDADRTCGGCGAPKDGLRETLLDVPATPDHWTNSLKDTIYRVLIGTVAAMALTLLSGLVGINGFVGTLAFLWAVPAVPTLLTYAAWRDAKGDFYGFFLRGFLVFPLWCIVTAMVLLAAGMATGL